MFTLLMIFAIMLFVPFVIIAFGFWFYSATVWTFSSLLSKVPTWLCWIIAIVLILALVL